MNKIAFFDTKQYDRIWFDKLKDKYNIEIKYYETKLNQDTAVLAMGCDGVCAFVNDDINDKVIKILSAEGIGLLAMRCAGYNNINLQCAKNRLHILRVPAYSPYAVAEHTAALMLCLNRNIHRAYFRTRDYNFSLVGLQGVDFHNKCVGIIGTGKIGKCFINICRGIGMKIIAYDKYPDTTLKDVEYVGLDRLFKEADVISLHCPLNDDSYHLLDKKAFSLMKNSTIVINTSRGALIDSEALCNALKAEEIRGAALDVYEEEVDFFYEDKSNMIIKDDILTRLISMPNVLVTSHQAFLTDEALHNIAQTTLENIDEYFSKKPLTNELIVEFESHN